MSSEIRLRLNVDSKSSFQEAADRHGVPLVHFITMAVHGYLRGIGDLSAIQPKAPAPAKPIARPLPPDIEWRTSPEGERYMEDSNGDEWLEGEVEEAYSRGSDPLRDYT